MIEKTSDRRQAICEKIRQESLEPAKQQAQEIIELAAREREHIRAAAKKEAEKIAEEAQKRLEEEKRIFESALEQAAKQTIAQVKQKLEQKLFNPALASFVSDEIGGAKQHAKLIEVLIHAIEKEGMATDLSVQVPKSIPPEEIVKYLDQKIIDRLKKGAIVVGDMQSGIRVRLEGKHMMLDLSDEALKQLVAGFVQKEFRKNFFR
jgi:V/A-type H+-transporting ATPase subunit E